MTAIVDGSLGFTAPVGAVYNGLQTGTTQTVSGVTAANFTSIPSWVKRITIQISNTSQTSSSPYFAVRIGSGSYDSSGYLSILTTGQTSTIATTSATTSFYIANPGSTSSAYAGNIVLTNISGTNTWLLSGLIASNADNRTSISSGGRTTTGVLDRVQVLCSDGTTTFSGTINIIYE